MTNIEKFTQQLMLSHDIDYWTALSRAEAFYKMLDTDRPEVLNDWISVDDRLPENKVNVLVTGKSSTMVAYHDACGWQYGVYEITGVTHWQPLPEPPKVE